MADVKDIKEIRAKKVREARAERYAMQSVARKAIPDERVSICLRNRIVKRGSDKYEDIKVWKHRQTHKAFYSGLIVCGSVWCCPICASKITERRKQELKIAFDTHKSNGGKIAMLTLTFSHDKTDKLKDLLDKFGQATQRLFRGKAFDNIRKELDLIGRIRVYECTYGDNGFHPHAHIALFYNNDVDLMDIRIKIYRLWEKACEKEGLKTSFDFGLDLQSAEQAEEYFCKHGTWSIEQEMTKWHSKKGKLNTSLTPFDFLRYYMHTEDIRYLKLFEEYAKAFKGKRQLQWSNGLKKRFIIEEKSDEELAKEKTEEADLLGILSWEEWKVILNNDTRSLFLDYIEKYGFDMAYDFIVRNNTKKVSSGLEDTQNIT